MIKSFYSITIFKIAHTTMIKSLSFILLTACVWQVQAARILIEDNKSNPLPNAVVWLNSDNPELMPARSDSVYEMSQKNREFVPYVLAVPQNAKVEFPNEDSILHHVYSFSDAKSFELKLYRDKPKQPIAFEQTGVVELGCNIHDWMLGYIVVVDSTLFAVSDKNGMVELPAQVGDYQLNIWHPGFANIADIDSRKIQLSEQALTVQVAQKTTKKIKFKSDEFDDY